MITTQNYCSQFLRHMTYARSSMILLSLGTDFNKATPAGNSMLASGSKSNKFSMP